MVDRTIHSQNPKTILIQAIALTFAFVFFSADAFAMPTCDAMFITRDDRVVKPAACERNSIGTAAYQIYPDGSALPNPALLRQLWVGPPTQESDRLLPELSRLQKASSAQIARVQRLSESLRSLFIEEISGGVSANNLSPLQKFYIERYRKVVVRTNSAAKACRGVHPIAVFDKSAMTIEICSAMSNLSLEALLPVLAHEFSHAAHPCDLNRASKTKFKQSPFETLKACTGKLGGGDECNSIAIESFADALGARMTAKLLARDSQLLKSDRLKDLLYMQQMHACRPPSSDHPGYAKSADRIATLLQMPEVQRAVGCSGLRRRVVCAEPTSQDAPASQRSRSAR